MIPIQKYKNFFSDLIRRHMLILGPNIARDVATRTAGLAVNQSGEVQDIKGDPLLILKDLLTGYRNLSDPVTQLVAYQLLEQYPGIKTEYNDPITQIDLTCALNDKKEAAA